MIFQLKEYHNNIGKDELLKDLQFVAHKLQKQYLSRTTYEKYGKYSATPYITNFGSWLNACKLAGLNTIRDKKDFYSISDQELLLDIKNVSKKLNKKTITTTDYINYGKYKVQTIITRYGTWAKALQKAGLEQTKFKIVTNQELFDEIERIWITQGRQPTTSDIKNGISKFSLNTYIRRFGGWHNTLETFVNYINSDNSKVYENVKNEKSQSIEKVVRKEDEKKILRQSSHRTPREINTRLRFKILQRDNFKCCACGASPAKDPSTILHVDHIIPWSKGGETIPENLQTLCSKCNLGKSNVF